jgi:CRISPR-associated protein Csx17
MFAVTIVTSFGTVLLSAWLPARTAAKIAAIDAIRGFGEIKIEAKQIDAKSAIENYRNSNAASVAEFLDAMSAPFVAFHSDNPLFMSKGIAGRSHVWRTYWGYIVDLKKLKKKYGEAKRNFDGATIHQRPAAENRLNTAQTVFLTYLFSEKNFSPAKGKGTPFFPDSIKTYNVGGGWVTESFPFAALDYILAVEGAFAMRGSVSRTLGSNTRRFAAFPFVFDAGEEMVDDKNKVKGTASALWFPIWERPATFAELSSFINDAQARLPKKDARFSSEFLRALYSQGLDAGFSGWQELRFRMKGSRVPWVTSGKYIAAGYAKSATLLNTALAPFDQSRFVDQFEIVWKGGDVDSASPHKLRAEINTAIENAVVSTSAENCIEILSTAFDACKQMTLSKTFREKSLQKRPPRFFTPLPMSEWNELLRDLEAIPEFEIARAVASIAGLQKQETKGKSVKVPVEQAAFTPPKVYSEVQPLLGSLLPLKLGKNGWYFPTDGNDRGKQAVWSGTALCRDLAAILQRRYMDSTKDNYPALQSVFPARLENILAFLNNELDDAKIARWIEALSLIGWHFEKQQETNTTTDGAPETPYISPEETNPPAAIPLPYAALRTLLNLECEYQKPTEYKRRRSDQPIAQLCTGSELALAQATRDALRWLGTWGVPNPWGKISRNEMKIMKGAYIINLAHCDLNLSQSTLPPERVAAAAAIPLSWRDHWQLHRLVTLPISG